jgi:hypothetical protein
MAPGSKQSGKQTGDAQIDIQFFPVQRVAAAQNFDFGQVVIGCVLETFTHARWEREPAAIGQLRDNPAAGGVKAHCLDARFIDKRLLATPFRIRDYQGEIVTHEFSATPSASSLGVLNFRHDPAHIGFTDPHHPANLQAIRTVQVYFRLSALPEDMDMLWRMVVRKNHESKTKRPVNRDH